MSQKAGVGFLLIHGLAGSNSTTQPLAEYLEGKGFTVVNKNLPGHGTTPEDLRKKKWTEWIDFAQSELDYLKENCNKVFVVGTSLGGVISLFLASRNDDLTGIILCSTALKPYNLKSWFVYNFSFIRYFVKWVPMKRFTLKFLGVPKEWKIYEKIPVDSVIEGAKLLKEVRKNLHGVQQPIILVHGKKDKLVPFHTIKHTTSELSSKDITVAAIESGGHVFLKEDVCNFALEEIGTWVNGRISK